MNNTKAISINRLGFFSESVFQLPPLAFNIEERNIFLVVYDNDNHNSADFDSTTSFRAGIQSSDQVKKAWLTLMDDPKTASRKGEFCFQDDGTFIRLS